MKYIKSFETEAAYEAGKGDLLIPYVAYTQDDEKVHYARRLEDLYDVVGTLVPGTESFNFKLNNSTTITPTIIGNRFVYNWTGSTITSLENAFNGKTALVSVDKFDVPVATSASTLRFARYCSNLTTPFFFNGQTTIGNEAFANCSGFNGTLTIPNSVTSIGQGAFACRGLTSITCLAATPPTLGKNAFSGTNCPIYVPAASVEAYKAASGWSDYSSRIEAIPTT